MIASGLHHRSDGCEFEERKLVGNLCHDIPATTEIKLLTILSSRSKRSLEEYSQTYEDAVEFSQENFLSS